ncbi:hypothetical protein ATCV1_z516R [Acanthocystis turfacea chlorella virus 1]|uniref:Uncharacterized protein z516R n=1 Tax=Chlorovirus heliozoae TaxID=322019 RepID=A7K9C6_9PHYC|nr:hypothetical protein ATCV1_z516R [Acanthocystis turfacea chlorella virus 1]ABT16650.1 hypothetical protein ATCV1_z516R [Acanthocystis turfacea chlorella virus 1]
MHQMRPGRPLAQPHPRWQVLVSAALPRPLWLPCFSGSRLPLTIPPPRLPFSHRLRSPLLLHTTGLLSARLLQAVQKLQRTSVRHLR